MRYIVDWHIHSKYSRACSSQLELPIIDEWCQRKGIDIVATGDWTHPGWFAHIKENLEEAEQGIYTLKGKKTTRFMLVQELSQIYKKNDRSRRIHNLVFSPSIETCEKVIAELDRRGFNLKSDGRPILGIDSEELYKVLKDIDEKIIIIPAHAWTPWYAIFGSKSGFDSIEECFGEMSKYIYAIETGLSSDPLMNWQLSALDDVVLVSNSDAHSPRNLGREANVFDLESPSYDEFVRILREKDKSKFLYTIEFHPEEGKYHYDGCADCKFVCDPKESIKQGLRCPHCKKKLTLGVHHRVEELSDRNASNVVGNKIPYKSIVPLAELIAESYGVKSPTSKRVETEYMHLTDTIASEFDLLLDTPIEEINKVANNENIAEAIRRVRKGQVEVSPGYDGIFGTVKVFGEKGPRKAEQKSLI
ncbi:endonuclease Q family protein [Patescibacteria group bacterium]